MRDTVPEQLALPGEKFSSLTEEQLFFIAFAQPFCASLDKIVIDPTDPHTPVQWRPKGAIRNFPAFRNAFNCPANDDYAPDAHCEVWVSDLMHAEFMEKMKERR